MPAEPSEIFKKRLQAREAAVTEPFKGITTDGTLRCGLFSIQSTGVPRRLILDAAETLRASLSPEERARAGFSVDSDAWRRWSNVHSFFMRHGVCLDDMSSEQRQLTLALLREGLSAQGFETARNVMKLNHAIGELTGRLGDEYGEWLYWLSLMGAPAPDAPWGWQIDGHHLIVNCFVLGDQIVMTPMFMGSEPVFAEGGKYAGTSVFGVEEQGGLALMRSLSPALQCKARVGDNLPGEVFGSAFSDNLELPYEGVCYTELPPDDQARLFGLIETYIGRMPPGHADVKMAEVRQHLAETYFAWMGGFGEDSVFYYRIHSPVILIEFDHQIGVGLENDEPARAHIHTVVRTPNGNDYGKDLLRQHYQRFDHSNPGPFHDQAADPDAVV